jgi:hypothetical protein
MGHLNCVTFTLFYEASGYASVCIFGISVSSALHNMTFSFGSTWRAWLVSVHCAQWASLDVSRHPKMIHWGGGLAATINEVMEVGNV